MQMWGGSWTSVGKNQKNGALRVAQKGATLNNYLEKRWDRIVLKIMGNTKAGVSGGGMSGGPSESVDSPGKSEKTRVRKKGGKRIWADDSKIVNQKGDAGRNRERAGKKRGERE